jgi:hypothetical protein
VRIVADRGVGVAEHESQQEVSGGVGDLVHETSRARSAAMSWVFVTALSGLSAVKVDVGVRGQPVLVVQAPCFACRGARKPAQDAPARGARRSMLGWLSSCV